MAPNKVYRAKTEAADTMIRHSVPTRRFLPKGLRILHEDRDSLVIDKPPGLLTIATDKEQSRTAYAYLTEYVRKGSATSHKRIFIVHRLDRETSGILIFAKSMEAKLSLQGQWDTTQKKYLAVVHGICKKKIGYDYDIPCGDESA